MRPSFKSKVKQWLQKDVVADRIIWIAVVCGVGGFILQAIMKIRSGHGLDTYFAQSGGETTYLAGLVTIIVFLIVLVAAFGIRAWFRPHVTYTSTLLCPPRSTPKTVTQEHAKQEFCLTARWKPEQYIVNQYTLQNRVVIDSVTDLMWQQSGSQKYLHYDDAEAYVQQLNQQQFAGYSNWRLPTVSELISLLEPKRHSHRLCIDAIFDNAQDVCWSSDVVQATEGFTSSAWSVHFRNGYVDWNYFNESNCVRAVRSR
jgi:hypothetical protein